MAAAAGAQSLAPTAPIMGGSLASTFAADAATSFAPGARFAIDASTGLRILSLAEAAGEFGNVAAGSRTAWSAAADLARFRLRAGLGAADTVASVVVNGQRYFGVNSGAQPAAALALREEFLRMIQQDLG